MNKVMRPGPARVRPRSGKRAAGFTLVEVVVAFVLLALVLTTGLEIFSSGLRRAGELEDRSRAILVAQSRLATAGLEQALADGTSQGDSEDGRFHWTMAVAQSPEGLPPPDQPQPGPGTFILYRVDVQVQWAGGDQKTRTYALSTLLLGQKPQ
jgi:general secretion pathway protein I